MNEVCSSDNHYTMPWQNSSQTMLIYQKSRFNQSLFSVRDFITAPISLKTLNNYRTSWLSEVYDFAALSGYVALDFSLICFWVYWNTKMSQKNKTEGWKKKIDMNFMIFYALKLIMLFLWFFWKIISIMFFMIFRLGPLWEKARRACEKNGQREDLGQNDETKSA